VLIGAANIICQSADGGKFYKQGVEKVVALGVRKIKL
jgi:hypothetical protein